MTANAQQNLSDINQWNYTNIGGYGGDHNHYTAPVSGLFENTSSGITIHASSQRGAGTIISKGSSILAGQTMNYVWSGSGGTSYMQVVLGYITTQWPDDPGTQGVSCINASYGNSYNNSWVATPGQMYETTISIFTDHYVSKTTNVGTGATMENRSENYDFTVPMHVEFRQGDTYDNNNAYLALKYVFSSVTGTPPNTPATVPTNQALSTAQTSKPRVPSSTQLLSFGSNPLVDPSKMTVVLTHGWNAAPYDWAQPMANALVAYINAHPNEYPNGQPNILAWDWHVNALIDPFEPVTAASRTPSEGTALGRALMDTLGPTYNKPIHFIGHSLGTLVNCVAADYIHGDHRPASDTRSSSQRYDPSKTHLTLLDEAELVGAIPSVPAVLFDLLVVPPELGGGVTSINGIIQTIRNSCSKVIPDRSAWIDNYLSEVGLVQSSAANVLLYGNPPTGGVQSAHGYAYRWYQETVANPAGSIMGMTWSFERNTLVPSQPARAENTYFLQNAVSGSADLGLTQIAQPSSSLFTNGQLILFGSAAEYSALHAESALASVPITVIQYSGNVGASVIQSFTIPNGSPTYLGTAGSTPAYFTTSSQTVPAQANYNFQIGIQPSASQLQAQTKRRAQKTASDVSANAVYTIVPIHVPNEAVGVSFEYQMTGAADDDFMTMGIGTGNSYTMEGEYVNNGEWNVTPMIQISSYHGQDTQLVFAMNGSNGLPAGVLNIRNIQFYTPPRPQLNLMLSGQQATLGWSLAAPGWTLQVSSSLSDPNSWQTANGTASDTNFQHTMTLNVGSTSQFYRLIK